MDFIDFRNHYLMSKLGATLFYCKKEFKELIYPNEWHHTLGMIIRDSWGLWESDREKKSELVKYFNSYGIYHADDMSSIILTLYHFILNENNIDYKREKKVFYMEIVHYRAYWLSEGFKDGIYLEEESLKWKL
jgi:hypothetical protein